MHDPDERPTFLKEKIPEDGISGHLGVDGDDATPDDLVPCMGGEEVVDALVDLVKVVVYLLEPAPLGEVWCTISVGESMRVRDMPGTLRWSHMTLTTSSQSSADSSSRLLNVRG